MKLSVYKNLPTLKSQLSTSFGFTLIELLVVIAIIGILAAALIATIDPLEQIRKSQDTSAKAVGVEYLGSVARYYATHQEFPWGPVADGGADCNTGADPASEPLDAGMADCTDAMQDENELKASFDSSSFLNDIFVTHSSETTKVCYAPTSKAFIADNESKYDVSGTVNASCDTVANRLSQPAGTCYWCAQ